MVVSTVVPGGGAEHRLCVPVLCLGGFVEDFGRRGLFQV